MQYNLQQEHRIGPRTILVASSECSQYNYVNRAVDISMVIEARHLVAVRGGHKGAKWPLSTGEESDVGTLAPFEVTEKGG